MSKMIINVKTILKRVLFCHNPSFGLAMKVRDCKVAGQKGSSGVKESVRG